MIEMTQNIISRTAFRYINPRPKCPDGNAICPYCKNQDTDRVQDVVSLRPFEEFYAGRYEKLYRVYSCHCCNAVWSVFKIED